MWQYNYSEELCHHGVLGMKWGHRNYKNEDGSLTPAGQKRASKEYKKLSSKAMNDVAKTETDRYVKAYNETVNEYNNGKIERISIEKAAPKKKKKAALTEQQKINNMIDDFEFPF